MFRYVEAQCCSKRLCNNHIAGYFAPILDAIFSKIGYE